MIRVNQQPEYPNFDIDVRQPGSRFLETCPTPTSDQFRRKNYWGRAGRELHAAYSGICAYTSMYLPELASVDHFLPKNTYPQLAYEWSNYRLASGRVNSSKGNQTNILDPFQVQDDWFFLEIPACLIRANPALDHALRAQISQTVNTLRLNQDDYYVQERCNILMAFAGEEVTFAFVQKRYPFLAKEVQRQQLDQAALRQLFSM